MTFFCALLAVLSIWDYPARFQAHSRLRRQFVTAVREGDTATMEESCRKGVKLLPDDPTWRYNLACSLAYFKDREDEAFDELEKAIDLGFRNRGAIAADTDLRRLSGRRRYDELLEYAERMKDRPILFGPMATVDATGVFGKSISLGEQNMSWDFDVGCFVAHLKLSAGSSGGNVGDLYMNRDGRHSMLDIDDYPGITLIQLDAMGRTNGMDRSFPNIHFPYPVFGNASLAMTQGPLWRSLPRAMMTTEATQLGRMVRFYLSNQIWIFPANADIAPVGRNGDVFASIAPYWITTAGRSYSDLPYLRAALEASRSLSGPVKREIVVRGLLAPTIQTLIRKSLKSVTNEVEYLSARAHPTAFPMGEVDFARLKAAAKAMTIASIPPLAAIRVTAQPIRERCALPECTYGSAFAWAFVLRAEEEVREYFISAKGAKEYAFVQTHGEGVRVSIERLQPDAVKVTVNRSGLSPTNRVDIAVVGRTENSGWGAPSYVSFSRMDPLAPYSDPVLTTLPQPKVSRVK